MRCQGKAAAVDEIEGFGYGVKAALLVAPAPQMVERVTSKRSARASTAVPGTAMASGMAARWATGRSVRLSCTRWATWSASPGVSSTRWIGRRLVDAAPHQARDYVQELVKQSTGFPSTASRTPR
jgi:hypothetical protein